MKNLVEYDKIIYKYNDIFKELLYFCRWFGALFVALSTVYVDSDADCRGIVVPLLLSTQSARNSHVNCGSDVSELFVLHFSSLTGYYGLFTIGPNEGTTNQNYCHQQLLLKSKLWRIMCSFRTAIWICFGFLLHLKHLLSIVDITSCYLTIAMCYLSICLKEE
jgi:hypothetical protein